MVRVLSSFCSNFFFRRNPCTGVEHQIRCITDKIEGDCGKEYLESVAKQVCRITRCRSRWEDTLLSDFPSFNFSDPSFLKEFLKLQGNAFYSLRFFLWLSSKHGFSLDSSSCNALFHALLEANAYSAAKTFLDSTNFSPKTATLEPFIRSLFREGLIPEGFDALQKLTNTGFHQPLETWNYALWCSLRFGRTDFFWKLYEQMMHFGVPRNADTVGYIIEAFCKDNKVKKAYELLKQIIDDGVAPPRFAFTRLISRFCEDRCFQSVPGLLHAMIAMNCPPDLYTYQEIIFWLFKDGRCHEGIQIFNDLKAKGYVPDRIIYNIIIHGLCEINHVNDAKKLWYEMIENGIIPNQHTYHSLIHGYCMIGDLPQAWNLLSEMRQKYKENTVSFTTMINGLCLKNRVMEARALFDEMARKGIKQNVCTYNTLIRGFSKAGFVDKGIEVLEELKAKGLNPTMHSYTYVIKKLCEKGRVEKAKELWKDMMRRGVEPAICVRNFIIIGLCMRGHGFEAMKWWGDMMRRKMKPRQQAFERLIWCLSRTDRLDDALFVLDRMLKGGVVPNRDICYLLITKLCKEDDSLIRGRLEEILQGI